MPFARLSLIPAQNPAITQALIATLRDMIAGFLGKRPDLTSILVETPEAPHWTVGTDSPAAAAHLEVSVTAGTNTEAEKRDFIANAMGALEEAVPGLPVATYVVIRELPASSWGYGGRTQADRAATKTHELDQSR